MTYVSNRDGNLEVYVMYLNTRISHRLTSHPRHDVNPAWSPDGGWIAFESNRAGMFDIYKIEPDGSNLQRLTHERDNYNPTWSPDGQSIAFAANEAKNIDIYVMNADGGKLKRLTKQAQAETVPTWSSNGETDRL